MSTSPINNLSNFQSILSSALQNSGLTTNPANTTNSNSLSGVDATLSVQQPDNSHLSRFAQLMSVLQQLQQSDPAKYQQVTEQIATNLQSAAKTAQSDGNTTLANQLNQLSTDFTNASKNGQLPNLQDLAQAIGGGHHHHHHAHAASADSDGNSNSSGNPTTNPTLNQLLSAFQSNGFQGDSLNPATIILNTLSNAGINVPNG
jgi:hypothetical protein